MYSIIFIMSKSRADDASDLGELKTSIEDLKSQDNSITRRIAEINAEIMEKTGQINSMRDELSTLSKFRHDDKMKKITILEQRVRQLEANVGLEKGKQTNVRQIIISADKLYKLKTQAAAAAAAAAGPAMAVAVSPSAQRRSPSPRGCWQSWKKCFSRKNHDRNPPPTGGRKSKTRKLKTRNTYKKRGASRK